MSADHELSRHLDRVEYRFDHDVLDAYKEVKRIHKQATGPTKERAEAIIHRIMLVLGVTDG